MILYFISQRSHLIYFSRIILKKLRFPRLGYFLELANLYTNYLTNLILTRYCSKPLPPKNVTDTTQVYFFFTKKYIHRIIFISIITFYINLKYLLNILSEKNQISGRVSFRSAQ